jgi:HprK-related kinase A
LAGEAGAGKSTLCAALALRGWRLFSDEIALVRPQDGQLLSLARPVSLKNESIEVIRHFEPEARLGTEWRDTVKGTVAHMRPPLDSVLRVHETATPAWVIFPRYQRGVRAEATRQTKGVTLVRLADNSFNYSLLRLRGFETMARLVEGCDCYKFRYSDLDEAVDRFDRLPPPGSSDGQRLSR